MTEPKGSVRCNIKNNFHYLLEKLPNSTVRKVTPTTVITPRSPKSLNLYRKSDKIFWYVYLIMAENTKKTKCYRLSVYDEISNIIIAIDVHIYTNSCGDIKVQTIHLPSFYYSSYNKLNAELELYAEIITLYDGDKILVEIYPDIENGDQTTIFLSPRE